MTVYTARVAGSSETIYLGGVHALLRNRCHEGPYQSNDLIRSHSRESSSEFSITCSHQIKNPLVRTDAGYTGRTTAAANEI